MKVVYASCEVAVVPLRDGTQHRVVKGSHWPADDPVVLAQPSLFSDDPRYGLNYSREPDGYDDAPAERSVEQATAGPGERRQVRRNS